MDKKYRINVMKNTKNQPNQEEFTFYHSKQSKNQHKSYFNPKKSKSQIMFSVQRLSPERSNNKKKTLLTPTRQIFSRLKPLSMSPQQVQNRGRSKTVPQANLSIKISRLGESYIDLKHDNTQHLSEQNQNPKFPHYVSKSTQMILTKQKLLQLKHQITMSKQGPILESIEQSINDDRINFNRKMKIQLCKKGNYSLIGYLEKNMKSTSTEEEKSLSKSKSKEKQYKSKNLAYLASLRHSDHKISEKSQKLEEIKKHLKATRKNNLQKHK